MKALATIITLVLTSGIALGQTIAVTGTVNDEKGQPVPFAFVRDVQHSYATYADSSGTFKLNADPASMLEIAAVNYEPKKIKIDNQASLNVVLPAGTVTGAGIVSMNTGRQTETTGFLRAREQLTAGSGVLTSNANSANGTGGEGGSDVTVVRAGFALEPTRGSRYMLGDWSPGFGVSKKDSLVVEITNAYNYDKMTGNIIYTNDGRSTAGVSPGNIRTFNLYDKKGHVHTFVHAPEINEKPFAEILLSTPKYKIYKKVSTKLVRADFHTDGVLDIGHRYDEYQDVERYYFVAATDNKVQSISLKKSMLKKMLNGDADSFIASQGLRDVDEDYIRDLSSSLSK